MHLMLHPLMPHLTEELWHSVTGEPETTFLALQPWPVLDKVLWMMRWKPPSLS